MVETTTIQITVKTRERLDKEKLVPEETYNSVIYRLLDKNK